MIGLVDLDLQQSTSVNLCPPNIEIMKLATYYKTELNTFCRLINLHETELTSYDKIYVFSEAEERPQVPEAFLCAPNVVLGGTAFTNGIYKPFENEIIDYVIPRTSIYKPLLADKYATGLRSSTVLHILENSYYRMYAGNNKLPITPVTPKKKIFIYDTDFFVPDWRKIIEEISSHSPSSIKPIHPIICKTVANYFNVRGFQRMARDAEVILDLDIPLDETPILMRKYKNKFLEDVNKTSNVYITIGGSYDSEKQYIRDFAYKLNLLYIFWSNKIPLKIKYRTPKIGYINPIHDLSRLVETWANRETSGYKSINDRIPKDKSRFNVRIERQQRDLVLQLFPSATYLFTQTRETVEKGGFWKYGY